MNKLEAVLKHEKLHREAVENNAQGKPYDLDKLEEMVRLAIFIDTGKLKAPAAPSA